MDLPTIIGFDLGKPGSDHSAMAFYRTFPDVVEVTLVPPELGYVTALRQVGGKIVADTASGVAFIPRFRLPRAR